MKMIPYSTQQISDEDIEAVVKALQEPFITQGPFVEQFEEALAAYTKSHHCSVVTNGTSALHLACLALGVGSGDRVWTSPISFVASANCALYCGAEVDFVDVDPITGNMSVSDLENRLILAKKNNQLPKVVIPVHLAGHSCEMKSVFELACEYGFSVIEDGSHGLGAEYRENKVGSCQFSQITCTSFHAIKNITTGEGGACFTNDSQLHQKIQILRSHGITRDPGLLEKENEGAWFYEQQMLGFNYRMTDIQCALGLSQLKKIDERTERKRKLAQTYYDCLNHLPLDLPDPKTFSQSAFHLFVVRIKEGRERLFQFLREKGVLVNVHYIPIYQQPYYQRILKMVPHCPNAEKFYSEAISLPMYSGMTDEQQAFVIDAILQFFLNSDPSS